MRRIRWRTLKCGVCGGVITSMHRHDFVYCPCGALFVDGGGDYLRFGGTALRDGKILRYVGRIHGFVPLQWSKVDPELPELFPSIPVPLFAFANGDDFPVTD